MKRLFLLLLSLACSYVAVAQEAIEIPLVIFSEPDTCIAYESKIVEVATWLEATDLNKEVAKRQEAVEFFLQWLSSCKSVPVEVTNAIASLYGKNDALLGIFLASFSRNWIENKPTPNQFDATKAAVTSMMTVYKKGIAITKSKEMEKAIKASNEGKLDDYIEQVIGVDK